MLCIIIIKAHYCKIEKSLTCVVKNPAMPRGSILGAWMPSEWNGHKFYL